MAEVIEESDHLRSGRSRAGRVAAWLAATPALLLAVSALGGLGLSRGLSAPTAFAAALLLVALPAAGLAGTLRASALAGPIAGLVWGAAVLGGLPFYFPGERGPATERGVLTLAWPAGDVVAGAAAQTGVRLVGLFGADQPPAMPRQLADQTARPEADPPARAGAVTAQLPPGAPRRPTTVVLPYQGDAASLQVRVDFDGPEVGEQLEMVFDTGATFTTLDRASLARLGVSIGTDAPWITLRTANGEIQAPLVLVDAAWLGDEPVEWVTIAVCDSCANPPVAGLLGLNVTGRFRVSLDHDRQRIELSPRRRARDSSLDIGQWLEIRSRATRDWKGSVEVAVTASNRSRRPIEEAVVDLSCGAQTFAIQVDDIPANGERTTEIGLPRGTDCSQQSIAISRGRWLLDRF